MASTAPVPGVAYPIEWRRESAPVGYAAALAAMEARNAAVFAGEAAELVWLLEHPPVYTAGTSADPAELVDPRFEVVEAGRGGRYTYHGPGQRVGYLVLDLAKRGKDVRCFVHAIEGWVIATLATFGVESWRAEGRDVYQPLVVAPWEAALGASVEVGTPGGSVIEVAVPAGWKAGRKLRLKGRGIPGTPPGDLYLELHMALPPATTDAERAAYAALAQAFPHYNPRAAHGAQP